MRCAGCGVELVGHPACPGCGTAAPADAVFPFTVPDLPPAPWVLTAPESYVLRYGFTDRTARLGAFKAALTELLARRALTLDAASIPRRLAPGVRGRLAHLGRPGDRRDAGARARAGPRRLPPRPPA